MTPTTRLEQQLNSFILFGGMMTLALRRQTAQLLFMHLYDPDYPSLEQLQASRIRKDFPNWYRLLHQLLQRQDLRDLARNNEDLAFSLARETLDWAKRTYLQFEASHDSLEEEQALKAFQENNPSPEDWQQILTDLSQRYPGHIRNWTFYAKTLAEQENSQSQRVKQENEILKSNILQDWEQFVREKKDGEEARFLSRSFNRYFDALGRKVDKLHDLGDLLSPFYGFLGLAWNDTLGNWNKINVAQLESYAESLARDRSLRELADLLGRYQRASKQSEIVRRQNLTPKTRWKPNPYGRSEIIGIHHSDEISRMLPSEVALLSSPETELILSKKYVEKKLLTFQYRSEDLSSRNEQEEQLIEEPKPEDSGPIILCVDTSGSMFGAPERVAKALA
ncbi:MAG: hypothetical protein AAF804_21030, partial [Bacteroidota bacterium]